MWNLYRLMWNYGMELRGRIALFVSLSVIAQFIAATQPVILDHLIESVRSGGKETLPTIFFWCAALGIVVSVFWAFHMPSRIIERWTAFEIYRNFVADLYRKVTDMPLRWHQDHHSGDTIGRVTKASKALFVFCQDQYVLLQMTVRFGACLAFLAWYSWWVALADLVLSAAIFIVVRRMDRTLVMNVREVNEKEHRLSAALYDYIGNITSVLMLRLQGRTRDEVERRFSAMRVPFRREVSYNEAKWCVLNIALVVMQAAMVGAYIGATFWRGEALLIGSVVAIYQYQNSIMNLFYQWAAHADHLLHQSIDIRSIDGIEADHRALGARAAHEAAPLWKDIKIAGLSFTHHEAQEKLHHLRDVSLSIRAGQKIALVGESGAGKTTLLTLLRGLYEAGSVSLNLDGRLSGTLRPLSGFTTLVPQEAEIFENTIAYNLTFDVDLPEEALRKALFMADFEEVVASLPQGLASDIRERGVNLSGGEKQRLALARGLLAGRDSSLLLLDEPTSNVDLATEARIFERLFSVYADKAIMASVHRLHLLPRFDWIIYMKDGKTVQQGDFETLTREKGPFLDLWLHGANAGE